MVKCLDPQDEIKRKIRFEIVTWPVDLEEHDLFQERSKFTSPPRNTDLGSKVALLDQV